jgi:hypothetical protein
MLRVGLLLVLVGAADGFLGPVRGGRASQARGVLMADIATSGVVQKGQKGLGDVRKELVQLLVMPQPEVRHTWMDACPSFPNGLQASIV